ncbi:MAG: glycosyltransferase family 2 protein [Candidatus Saccharimonadales bacterium]
MSKSTSHPVVVIPNLNGGEELLSAVKSLIGQTLNPHIIVVDNASADGSVEKLQAAYPSVEIILNGRNEGYAGGVNPGLRRAIELGADYAAPFNDDAVADKDWLKHLVDYLEKHPEVGAAACKVLKTDGKYIDSTGDFYTVWGLPYPRGRGEVDSGQYNAQTDIFAASGAASLFRVETLKEVGLFDEDFFAYYEDVDLGFRMQLAGWKVAFVPDSVVYHAIGMTSGRIKGFTTYQAMKNTTLLLYKNVPRKFLWRVGWRHLVIHTLFFARSVTRGQGWIALRGDARGTFLLFKKHAERKRIQKSRKVSDEYIWGMMVHNLPPNANVLRILRTRWWKIIGRKT